MGAHLAAAQVTGRPLEVPLAVTAGVFAVLSDTRSEGQDFQGRAWDMLNVLLFAIRASRGGDPVTFDIKKRSGKSL